MSPTIRIDDEVFAELKKHAEPLVDTPNTVLRRILGLGGLGARGETVVQLDAERDSRRDAPRGAAKQVQSKRRPRRRQPDRAARAKSGTILSEAEYEIPMLEIIAKHGGRAAAREVLDDLGTRLDGRLTDVDKQELSSGNIRWRNRAQFVRLRLVERGDMVKNSPRGVWEITAQGSKRVQGVSAS